jgi:hypothetical protein
MRTLMQLTVPGKSSAGRLRFTPWRDMYRISPLKPARSQSRKCASSVARSMRATPSRANPSSRLQRCRAVNSAAASKAAGDEAGSVGAEGLMNHNIAACAPVNTHVTSLDPHQPGR